jgi:UDP-3-O-[3-hydroxymyristoyl] glucosamine N-acyltransferase
MKFTAPKTLEFIANLLEVEFVGDKDFKILGINEIHVVEPGDIVFVDHPKYYDKALQSAATTILINKQVACPEGKTLLISEDPFADFNKLTTYFKPFIAATAAIATTASIGQETVIQPNVLLATM